MPIPGSILNSLTIDPKVAGDEAFPSIGTFLSVTSTQAASGQVINTFAPIDTAHTNLHCRKAPPVLLRPGLQEKIAGEFQLEHIKYTVVFNSFIPDVNLEWRLMVDALTYEILAAENDGNSLTTRVSVGQLVPFNA